jgi:hypothetical protein
MELNRKRQKLKSGERNLSGPAVGEGWSFRFLRRHLLISWNAP